VSSAGLSQRSQVALAASEEMRKSQPALRATAALSAPSIAPLPGLDLLPSLAQASAAGSPAAVVFVHGVRTSNAIWGRQLAHVRDAGHLAVAVDLPGHGERNGERFTLARAFEILDDAVASFPDDVPVVVVGMSLGGYTSLAYAASHPERLAGVVACACSADPRGKPVALFREAAALVDAAGAATRRALGRVQGVLRAGRSLPGGARASAQLTGAGSFADPQLPGRPAWQVVTDVLHELAGRSSRADLSSAKVPVWLINGQRDHLRLDEKRYLDTAPGTALVVVPRAGHDVNLDAPDAFNAALTRALGDLTSRWSPAHEQTLVGAAA
jgi:pimeloyl-ACP methyl ester carboxylesterase